MEETGSTEEEEDPHRAEEETETAVMASARSGLRKRRSPVSLLSVGRALCCTVMEGEGRGSE